MLDSFREFTRSHIAQQAHHTNEFITSKPAAEQDQLADEMVAELNTRWNPVASFSLVEPAPDSPHLPRPPPRVSIASIQL